MGRLAGAKMKKLIPILEWLPNYKKTQFKGDLFAGITVAIILIPQGIAYAMIAGLPPIYGLYTALIPQIIYAVFGSSRQVAIGPVAMDSLIVATGVTALALRGSESYIAISILLGLMVGLIQFLMGVFRLGFVVNFLSKPVISGFTSAVAMLIGLNQFKNLLGVEFIQSDEIHVLLKDIFDRIGMFNSNTTIIGLVSCVIIIIFRKINKKIPNAIIVVAIGIVVMKYFGSNFKDVAIVKDIPSGLPAFSAPVIDISLFKELLPAAITLVMIGYLEIISIGKTLEAKQDEYRIRPNQELVALGLSNIIGSFFKSYLVTASFSRSAINQESGGKTGISALISTIMVMITLLFLTPVFHHLPKTVLASIIVVAVFNLIQIKEAKRLWRISKLDFWLMISTFIATLFLNIELGVLVGVALSLIVLIFRTSRPYVTELGKVPESNFYKNKKRFKEVIIDPEVLVFRFDSQLFYANASYFRERLEIMTEKKGKALKLIVLDGESINRVDSTGIDMLKDCIVYFQKREILFYFAGIKGPVRDDLFRGGILDVIDLSHFFMRANGAVTYYKTGDNEHQKKYAQYIHQAYN